MILDAPHNEIDGAVISKMVSLSFGGKCYAIIQNRDSIFYCEHSVQPFLCFFSSLH